MSSQNPYSDNPYSSSNTPRSGMPSLGPSNGLSLSYLTQIRVIGILMIVNGCLLSIMGLFLSVFSLFFPAILAANPNGRNADAEVSATVIMVIYLVMGVIVLIPGIVQIIAGIRNCAIRGRIFGIVALSLGLVSIFTCYCSLTSLPLFIYGIIIYMNPSSKVFFELASQGYSYADLERYVVDQYSIQRN